MAEQYNRRAVLVGAGVAAAALVLPENNSMANAGLLRPVPELLIDHNPDIELIYFWQALTVGVASALVVDTLKTMGWWPGSGDKVKQMHHDRAEKLGSEGYQTKKLHGGSYAAGEGHPFRLSEARRGSDYKTFGSTHHAMGDGSSRDCIIEFEKPDLMAQNRIAHALKQRGLSRHEITANALPVHACNEHYHTPTGTVSWQTRGFDSKKPTIVARIDGANGSGTVRFFTEGNYNNWGHEWV